MRAQLQSRLERRQKRLEKRLVRVEADPVSLSPGLSWVVEHIDSMGVDLDDDGDGVVEFAELVGELEDLVLEHTDIIPDAYQLIVAMTAKAVAKIALRLREDQPHRLRRRIARIEARLASD